MIALKVYINGEHIVTAGQDDWTVLAAHISASRGKDEELSFGDLRYSVGGLSKENAEGFGQHFRWPGRDLTVGDKIEIEIVDTQEITEPAKRYRSDSKVQENPYTEEEWKEMRYQDYLELKKEFESNVT